MNKARKLRYGFALFFILCGLIIGIVGGYGCMAVKHYEGAMLLTDSRVSQLTPAYVGVGWNKKGIVARGETSLSWDFYDTRNLEGFLYTTYGNFLWLPVVIGLFYVGLGIWGIINKDFLFKKDEIGE